MNNKSTHPPARRITRAMLLALVITVCAMVIEWLLLSVLNVGNRVMVLGIIATVTSVALGIAIGQRTRKQWQKEKD